MSEQTTPCRCNPPAVRSSRELEPGAELVDVTDADGRWHAVRCGERVYRVHLAEPSAAYLAACAARRAEDAARAAADPLNVIRAKRIAGRPLTPAEQQLVLDKLLGVA